MNATYFQDGAAFRRWLDAHHATKSELWIGYFKKGARQSGITYREALDEALCFGWIDGMVRRIDEERYAQRFTPRRKDSVWSRINVGHVERLSADGRMHHAGLAAFAARKPEKTGIYSFEPRPAPKLPRDFARKFRANAKAWAFFSAQPPGYRRNAIHRVMHGKQPATRERWLARLIESSAAGRRLSLM
jgi:uncharacterized protein YdeI (YjbR/CyaY-like superfamily)